MFSGCPVPGRWSLAPQVVLPVRRRVYLCARVYCWLWSSLSSVYFFFFSSRRRHTRCLSDWSSDVCSSDLTFGAMATIAVGFALLAFGLFKGGLSTVGILASMGLGVVFVFIGVALFSSRLDRKSVV